MKRWDRFAVGRWLLASGLSVHVACAGIEACYVEVSEGCASPEKRLPVPASVDREIPEGQRIALYPSLAFQVLEGIGGAFNENGGEALLSLPKSEQDKLMQALFGDEGAAFTFNRLPVGATDFSLDAYSFSETAGDYAMQHFSFDRERRYMLPYLKAAYAVNGGMKLQSSPWSPPGWMKGSGVMDKNDKHVGKDELRRDPKVYAAYAEYLARFVKAYAAEGIRVDYLCIQNEPDTHAYFPGCFMSPDQMIELARDHVRPAFVRNGLGTGLFAGTFRTVGCADHLAVASAGALDVFDGVGFQYAKGYSIQEMQTLAPGKKLIHTEGKCHHGENSAEQARLRLAEVADYINSGVVNYCYWNLILNEESQSTWGWKQNSLVTIDRKAGTVTYNPDFNAMLLISRTLRPGDVRIGSFSRLPVITVKSPDGTIKVLVQNETGKEVVVGLDLGAHSWPVRLPPHALCAVMLRP